MVSPTIKAVMMISAVVAVVALFLKASAPMAVDFSLSLSPPILLSSFLSWLKPPYLFVAVNVIIAVLVASSNYHDDDKIETEPIVDHEAPPMRRLGMEDVDLDADFDFAATFPPPISVAEVEKSEEKDSGLINGGDEKSEPSMIDESENLSPAEKPLVSASSGHRKPAKASPKGGKRRNVLRVGKPKRQETTVENTWKMITEEEEEKSTPLTINYRRSDTFGVGAGEMQRAALRKSETFRDVTNYQKSSVVTVKPPVKMKKEMSPSREELNRRVEAFIKKCKEERLESLRLDKEVA